MSINLKYLLNQLNSANIKKDNPALHNTIQQLIQFSEEVQAALQSQIDSLKNTVQGSNLPNKAGGLAGGHYLTSADDTPVLVNSRNLLAGTNISFDDSISGKRTVSATGLASDTATFLTKNNETATLPNSIRLVAGTNVTFDDSVANVRTINVSASSADYVVMSDGAEPPAPVDDGFGNFIYIEYAA